MTPPSLPPSFLREKYKVLERFEIQIPEDQLQLLDSLDPEWAKFQVALDDAANKLEKYKDNFREKVRGGSMAWRAVGVGGCGRVGKALKTGREGRGLLLKYIDNLRHPAPSTFLPCRPYCYCPVFFFIFGNYLFYYHPGMK